MRHSAPWLVLAMLIVAGILTTVSGPQASAALAQPDRTQAEQRSDPEQLQARLPRALDGAISMAGTSPAPQSAPPARYKHVAAWDADDQQLLVFSGQANSGSLLPDLWSFQPAINTWADITPTGPGPSARQESAGAWDAADKQFLVFGGFDGDYLNDLWAYRPAQRAWVQVHPSGTPPTARAVHTAVWDAADNQLIIYGGNDGTNVLSSLWAYRPATNRWAQLTPPGDVPSPRIGHTSVWDSKNNQMLVFAGSDTREDLGDLWSYSPGSNAWTLLTPATGAPRPAARVGQGAAWDSANNQMVMYAGISTTPSGLIIQTDVWAFQPTGNAWSQLTSFDGPLDGRADFAAAWDSSANQMVIFGGTSFVAILNDTWGFRPASGAWVAYSAHPDGRTGHSAVWNPADNLMYVHGGAGDGVSFNDLWSYDPLANLWILASTGGDRPFARNFHSAAWDTRNAQMLVFGGVVLGDSNDLWRFKLTSNTWLQLSPALGPPALRDSGSAVWDPIDNEMLVFGGFSGSTAFGDLWAYRPAVDTWTRLTPTGAAPSPRGGQTAVWDSADNEMLVFGGDNTTHAFGDVWAYQPALNTWTQLTPTGATPTGRSFHSAVWDTADNGMIVFGGGVGSTNFGDFWAYRPAANAWTQLDFAGALPSARNSQTAIWDTATSQMVIFGGMDDARQRLSDVWFVRPPAPAVTNPTATATPTASVTPTASMTPTASPTQAVAGLATATVTATPPVSTAPGSVSGSTPTATPTSAVPVNTLPPTPTATPGVGVQSARTGAGRLQATISARMTGCSPNGQLISIHVTRTDNATVDLGGRTAASGDFAVVLPAGTAQAALVIHRVTTGQASTVSMIVTDGCGQWPTFVGGGPDAF